MMFGSSESTVRKNEATLREQTKCDSNTEFYSCFDGLSAEEITKLKPTGYVTPDADNDFFDADTTTKESYKLSQR